MLLVWREQRRLLTTDHSPTAIGTERIEFILLGVLAIGLAIVSILYLVSIIRAQKIVNFERLEAQNSKDELLSLASHQLRTPATAVKQYLGMVLEGYVGSTTKQQYQILKKAYLSNERQIETINQILYITRADAGRLVLQKSNFNLNQVIKEVMSDIAKTIKENHQKLVFDPTYVDIPIFADKHCIRLVIENLLTNASKYTYKGGKITIETDRNDNNTTMSVSDTGVGIHSDDRNKLFKKFSRLDNELSIQAGGSGLGLFLGKILVEMHGGNINVTSKPQEGSTFTVQLPTHHTKIRLTELV